MGEGKKWHQVRVDTETHQELERLSKARKPKKKPMAQIIRERVFQGDVKSSDFRAIDRLLEINNSTRQDLSRVTANINQLAKAWNQGKLDPLKTRQQDQIEREKLIVLLKELFTFNESIQNLLLEIKGRK